MAARAAGVLSSVRERVRKHISVPASDTEALKICFLCSAVESDALLELAHSRIVRTEARAHCDALAITPYEFNVILDDDSLNQSRKFNLTAALTENEAELEQQQQRKRIESALRLTLAEPKQRELWQSSPRVRTRVALAILRKHGHAECMQHALGEVLGSDLRRVDDLRADTEEVGIDIMNVAALISTVCTQITAQ